MKLKFYTYIYILQEEKVWKFHDEQAQVSNIQNFTVRK